LRGQSRDSIGTVLCIDDDDGVIRIGFTGASRGWQADPADFERVEEFKVGDWVRVRHNLHSVKHGFGAVIPGSIGLVYGIRPDSSLLIEFSYLPSPWLCEPEEVEPFTPFRVSKFIFLFVYMNVDFHSPAPSPASFFPVQREKLLHVSFSLFLFFLKIDMLLC
jgi:hypothetical protein